LWTSQSPIQKSNSLCCGAEQGVSLATIAWNRALSRKTLKSSDVRS
jgi:hypothetical protein